MSYTVINIHGTFDQNSKFIREPSDFCSHLKENLGDAVISPFDWSGKNSISDRYKSGIRLAEKIEELSNLYPDRKIILIAHSHGGNIIRYALSDETLKDKIHKIVYLATPFIKIRKRSTEDSKLILEVYELLIFTLILALLIASLFVNTPNSSSNLLLFFIVVIFSGALYIGYWGSFKEKISKKNAKMYLRIATMLINQNHAYKQLIPVLSISYDLDEARILLKFVQLISNPFPLATELVKRESNLFYNLTIGISVIIGLFILYTGFVTVGILAIFLILGPYYFIFAIKHGNYRFFSQSREKTIREANAFLNLINGLASVVFLLIGSVFSLFSKYHHLGYGTGSFSDILYLTYENVEVADVHPYAQKRTFSVKKYINRHGFIGAVKRWLKLELLHSEVYLDKEILNSITGWILEPPKDGNESK
ncbi:hypothetical protein DYBT9275_00918 [Dyadobacter sp. CECT 9275]|uniref:Alpha/beta hydrolase n=1 Tax=Dyadobacter helix TaxID=2822344 RepID=A0A916J9I9_9BACT|nr:alpha/beta fold hydrolase [Dyadobacter sp. CECT 9275]CAG4992224.1 hypothetical protein DYBT9275_00918 [Dyadobacter sp. CECT 9275]